MNTTSAMNNTSANSVVDPQVQAFRYIGIIIGIIDIFVGTAGNLLTITAVSKNKHLRKQPFNKFIVNLSKIDLITSLFMMPLHMVGYVRMEWPFGKVICSLQAFFYFSCGYSSIVCLIAITINRLVGVLFPNRYHLYFTSSHATGIFLVLCWLVAPVCLLPFLVHSFNDYSRGEEMITGWETKQLLCTFRVEYLEGPWLTYMKILRTLFQIVPSFVMIASYSIILYCVRKSNERHKKNNKEYFKYKERITQNSFRDSRENMMLSTQSHSTTSFFTTDTSLIRCESGCSSTSNRMRIGEKRPGTPLLLSKSVSNAVGPRRNCGNRLIYIGAIICSTFTLLFLPSTVINLISGSTSWDQRIHMGASNITWLNSCVNPFVYVFLHKGMRKEYKLILKQLYFWLQMHICGKQEETS